MESNDSTKVTVGYYAEYGGLRLLVRQKEYAFEFFVFDKAGKAVVWRGTAPNMEAAKDAALFEARESLAYPQNHCPNGRRTLTRSRISRSSSNAQFRHLYSANIRHTLVPPLPVVPTSTC